MNVIRVETTIENDGELYLSHLPCRKGDRVEATVSILESQAQEKQNSEAREKEREAALKRFLALARASRFRSTGPYPSRDELHERS